MKISDSELKSFANNPKNRIELGQCDLNAYKVYTEFQAEIHVGYAKSHQNGISSVDTPHYWNVKKYLLKSGEEVEQLIDIYNYKEGKTLKYFSHNGEKQSIEDFENFVKK
jgi:hypothetical protein